MEKENLLNNIKNYFVNEILITGIGWIAGLASVQLMSNFFTQKSWSNIWGLWTDKIIIEESTYNLSEKIITVIVGFLVMKVITSVLIPVFSKKSIDRNKKT